MEPDIIPAPAEAGVIKTAREAAGMTIQAAAERSRDLDPESKGVSPVYWGYVERGAGGRRGVQAPARASDMKLALMAATVGLAPGDLTRAGREDAAAVLAEMGRRRRPAAPADDDLPQVLRNMDARKLRPWLEQVDRDLADALTGERQAFDDFELGVLRNDQHTFDAKRVLVAYSRMVRYGDNPGASRSRNTG